VNFKPVEIIGKENNVNTLPFKSLGWVTFLKNIPYAHQGCIYLNDC